MIILKDYSFLEDIVKGGEVENSLPFNDKGLCLADDEENPQSAYVFFISDTCIWWAYAYTNKINKEFYKFHNEVMEYLYLLDLPILGTYKNDVFKNHTKEVGRRENAIIYEYIKGS